MKRIVCCVAGLAVIAGLVFRPVMAQKAPVKAPDKNVKVEQPGSIEYIQNLARKDRATTADLVRLFVLQTGKAFTSYSDGVAQLVNGGLLPEGQYEESESLRKGLLSLVAVRYLGLDDSLWYNVTGAGRYAYRICVSEKFFRPGGSEYEFVSGSELLELMGKISARTEESNVSEK